MVFMEKALSSGLIMPNYSFGKINFFRVKVKFSGLYVLTYLEVRSTLTRKYNDLPWVTLPIFSKFSPSALMLIILKTNQYSSEVLFMT